MPADGIRVVASKLDFDTSRRQLNAQATPFPGVCGKGVRDVAYWARSGSPAMSDLSPLSEAKLKSDFGAVRAAFDPNRT